MIIVAPPIIPDGPNPPTRRIAPAGLVSRHRTSYEVEKKPMGVAAITTVCTVELLHELREFLPAARVAFPGVPIIVWTDDDAQVTSHGSHVPGVEFRVFDRAASAGRTAKVATHAAYWHADAIHQKIVGLRQVVNEYPGPDGVLLVDCDVTFRLGFERRYQGDVVLSPFYWGQRTIAVGGGKLLQHRDGEFNAGMLITRSLAFCDWWLAAYESGLGGFYEQGCLDLVPGHFVTDYFSPLHNFGKWRFSPPSGVVMSYHQHLEERSRRHDVGAIKIAAQRVAAEARAALSADVKSPKKQNRKTANTKKAF